MGCVLGWALARQTELKNFTGIDAEYQPPLTPEVHLRPDQYTTEQLVQQLLGYLQGSRQIPQ